MATPSTQQHDCTRHVAEDTLQSLNLKTDNNFHEYIVLIVGINDRHYLFEKLPTIISKDRVKLCNDIKSSFTFIHSVHDKNIFLITSGTLGEEYVHKFVIEPLIIGLYIYCMDTIKHTLWAKGIEKIRCTVSEATQLFSRLHGDIKQLSGRWPLGEKSFQKALTMTSQWYHLFLVVLCNRSEHVERSYDEMFNECRAYYRNNSNMIQQIEQLQRTYESGNAIREYTQDSFLYRIVNHALRTQNIETIRKFSPFIQDLHSQLYDHHQKYYLSNKQSIRVVYRGQYLSPNELDYLSSVCKSRNPVITLTTFTSTSLDPEVALSFVFAGDDHRIPCLFEIIITDEYNIEQKHKDKHEQVFANIASQSVMESEQEVLFSLVTHFRVKYVEYPTNLSNRSWILVILELITDRYGECSLSHLDIITRVEKETDPQVYTNILHMLQVNAADELKFENMNWQSWWNKLKYQWGTGLASDEPLHLIFYDCFTQDVYWSRKAIEIHKNILHSIPEVQLVRSSFSNLFNKYKAWQKIPTKWIALYEEYLEPFCTENTKEVIQCLRFAGETYEMIADKERARECYQQACNMNVDDKYQMNSEISKKLKKLKKSSKTILQINNERRTVVESIDKEFSEMYEAQQEQWSIYWKIKSRAVGKPSIISRLDGLFKYLTDRENWYDASDSKIILRIPPQNTPDLSVNDYRSCFLSAVEKHISSSIITTDASNNRLLSLCCYEKYMHEWILFKVLEKFLQLFQNKSTSIRMRILPQLERLLKKLNVLITLCTVYICIEQTSGEINVNNIPFINFANTETKKLVFFDLRDSDLLAGLQALEEEHSATEPISITILDHEKTVPMEISDFIEQFLLPS